MRSPRNRSVMMVCNNSLLRCWIAHSYKEVLKSAEAFSRPTDPPEKSLRTFGKRTTSMKLLGYCLLVCLFATRVQLKPQITKLFPVEELLAYHQQANNITKPLVDKFLGKLRTTYDLVFRQPGNTSHVEKILMKSGPDLQSLRLLWAQVNQDNYTDLKYPNDTFLDHVKSLSTLKDHEKQRNASGLQKDSSVEVKSIIERNGNNGSLVSSNQTKTLNDNRLNNVQPLGLLELQDEEVPDARAEVEIVTPGSTIRLSTTVGQHLIEWLGSIFGLTYSIYTKLSSAACGNEKVTH